MSGGLLPCPFCGGEAKRFTIEEEGDNFGGDVIACTGVCGASSHVEFGRKENLVSLWNTRVTTQQDSVDVERLRAALRAIADESERPNGRWVHLRRVIALHARTALSLPITQRDEQGSGGTFACPICGEDKTHDHTLAVVHAYQNMRRRLSIEQGDQDGGEG